MHQSFDEHTLGSSALELRDLRWREFFLWTKADPPCFRFLNAIHLPLGAYFGFKLRNGTEHVEQQTACRVAGVNVLIEHLEVHSFPCQCIGNVAQMEGGAGQPIQAGYHERVAFPDIFQAVVESRPTTRRPTVCLLEDFVAVPQLVQLDIEVLSDGTHPRIANKCHIPVSCFKMIETI